MDRTLLSVCSPLLACDLGAILSGFVGTVISVLCQILFSIVPVLGLAGVCFWIAIDNWGETCDGSMMPLPTYLLVTGIVSIFFSIYQLGMITAIHVGKIVFLPVHIGFVVLNILSILIYFCFLVSWNIVGSVALFRGGSECKDQADALWILVLVILCLQWYAILCTALTCFGLPHLRLNVVETAKKLGEED